MNKKVCPGKVVPVFLKKNKTALGNGINALIPILKDRKSTGYRVQLVTFRNCDSSVFKDRLEDEWANWAGNPQNA